MNNFWKRIWTEINLDNLIYNFNSVKSRLKDSTQICCVVKANAYGHHAPRIASTLEKAGADWFAVSNIEEALQLRQEGITKPVLILGYTPVECASVLSENNISQCIFSYEYALEMSQFAVASNCKVKAHIKIDTGMGRIGFQYSEKQNAITEIKKCCELDGLYAEGIFTHFAVSDTGESGKEFTYTQYQKFIDIVKSLEEQGIRFEYKHCANSGAAIDYPEFQMNMVRAGIVLYGLLPSKDTAFSLSLKPVMSLKTVVSYVKEVDVGTTVSYGSDFVADKKMKIATVPMGYADGFWRSNGKNSFAMLIKGQKADIVGRICMDQLMLDVSEIADVKAGDVVTVFGDDELINTVDDLATANNTINYEILCSVGKRVPRVFISDGRVDGIHLGILDTTVN